MSNNYSSISVSFYKGKTKCFLWVFNRPVIEYDYNSCPLGRKTTKSLFTKLMDIKAMENIDPEELVKSLSITREDNLPKRLYLPNDISIKLKSELWSIQKSESGNHMNSYDPKMPNVLFQVSQEKRPDKEKFYFDTDEELEQKMKTLLYTESVFDGYHYYEDIDGNLKCSGYSMSNDIERCSDFKDTHPEVCKNCSHPLVL